LLSKSDYVNGAALVIVQYLEQHLRLPEDIDETERHLNSQTLGLAVG
jgi:hypothetical protein